MVAASEIAFGVEIETTLPGSDTTPIGPYHNGYPVGWLPAGWKVERDNSISAQWGRKKAEFVSPVLKGREGLTNLRTAIHMISERGGKVNYSCGIHVTVTWNGNAQALARLLSLFANHEKAFYAATGTKRRESGQWAKSIKAHGNADVAKMRAEYDRYHAINLTHLAAGKNRIEFRLFSGSLNKDKVTAFVLLVLALVELAQDTKRSVGWNYAKGGGKPAWQRAGEGHTELVRLFYRLGWTKGHQAKGYGLDAILCEGDVIDRKSIKAILVKMAKKYDRS